MARIFRQFKLDWSLGRALDHGNAFPNPVVLYKVRHGQLHEITSAELAIDGDIKQSQIALITIRFEPGSDCPNLFWQQGPFFDR